MGAMFGAVAKDRLFRALLIAFAVFSGVLCFVPLFNVLGYEFSVSIAILLFLSGGVFVAVVARQARIHDHPPSVPGLLSAPFAAAAALLAVPLAVMSANAVRVTNCSWADGIGFYLLIPGVTGFILAGYTTLVLLLRPRPWVAVLAWYAAGGLEIAARLRELYVEPQTFFFSHVIGWFPGPIYDEALEVSLSLFAFRAASACIGVLFLGAAICARARLRSAAGVVLCAAAAGVFVYLNAGGEDLLFKTGRERLVRELEGIHRTARFDIRHYRDSYVKKEISAIAAAHEFHLSDIEKTLGLRTDGRITSYIFKNAGEKKVLTGSGGTNIAKPWLDEVYVNAETFPYPTLRHEIAHVVMGRLAGTALGVPGRLGGLMPNLGLVEGAAVALEGEGTDLTRHQAAKLLLLEDLLPDMHEVFSASKFYTIPMRRAYTAAGSLMLWLLETRGPKMFVDAYRRGSLPAAYGAPLGTIVAEWKEFLGAVPLSEAERAFWASPYRKPSIFGQICAHEAAALRLKAALEGNRGMHRAAAKTYISLCKKSCTDSDRKSMADQLIKAGETAAARDVLGTLLKFAGNDHWLRADTLDTLGMLAWEEGRTDEARRIFSDLAAMHLDLSRRRSADLRVEALGDPLLASAMLGFFSDDSDSSVRPVVLFDALGRFPDYDAARYLLGRHLFNRGEFARAAGYLATARRLPSDILTRENLKLLGLSLLNSGRPAEARTVFGEASEGGSAAWQAHCTFLGRMAESEAFGAR
jgi:tetratricopeptide (TPR) repeat protein